LARDVDEFLQQLGLAKYAALFAEHEVDLEILPELTEQDLKDLDIPLGPRKKLIKAIAILSSGGEEIESQERTAAKSPAPHIEDIAASRLAHEEAERRQLTVMFCDMVGSTALSARLDPEDLRDVMRSYHDACATAITRYNGYIAKYMGDGVLAYFGYPQANENDPERAVRAGLDVVEAVTSPKEAGALLQEVKLAVRVGIDTGPVVVGDIIGEGAAEEASVVGETPNIAARLQVLANPGEVVVGALTRALVGEAFAYEDLGMHDLKGIANPLQVWRVLHERDIGSEDEAELAEEKFPPVGREEELGLLLRSWSASKQGQGQVVLIQGEAGIGKSKLIEALRERISNEDCIRITVRCSPYHMNSTLYPVIEHLKRVLAWTAEDDEESRLAKLENVLKGQRLALEVAVPLYAELLSLQLPENRYKPVAWSARERREKILDALLAWYLEQAERQLVLCVWEDLHWADPTTLELLGMCIEQSPTVSMMTILTYRHEFAPHWTMRSHMTPITLNRLGRREAVALIARQTAGKPLPQEVENYILDKSDGVPLYVEQLTKAILEADYLQEKDNSYELTGPLAEIAIPTTLQDSLMARLDRWPTIREVAQLGAVFGREFAYEMLQAVASIEETVLQSGLDRLVDAELLYQRGRRPQAKYIFKHALVQDAAYQSLLKRTQQYYHRQVAELLENCYPEVVQSQPELIAHHYARAEQADKAVEYLTRVGDNANAAYAHAEAISALEEACRHAERLPDGERDRLVLDLVVRRAQPLHFLGRRQEIVDLLEGYQQRVERLEEPSLSGPYFFWLGFAHGWLGHRTEAGDALRRSLAEAISANDEAVQGQIHRALATEYFYSGRPLDEAIEHGKEAVELLGRSGDQLWFGQALFVLSYCYCLAGDFDSAIATAVRLQDFGEISGDRRARANAAMLIGLARATRGEGEAGIEMCEQALEISPDSFETAFILACLGRACLEAGNTARAVNSLEQAVEIADKVRSVQFHAWFRIMLGEAYLVRGDLYEAVGVIDIALAASTEAQFLLGVAFSNQLLGRVASVKGGLEGARQYLEDARQMFTTLGARFELGRTCLELATITYAQGAHDSAATHLHEARSLFSALGARRYVERADELSEHIELPPPGEPA